LEQRVDVLIRNAKYSLLAYACVLRYFLPGAAKSIQKTPLMAASPDSGDWIRKIFHVADFCMTFIRRMRQHSSEKFLCLSVACAVRLTSWF